MRLKRSKGDVLTAEAWNSMIERLPEAASGSPASFGFVNRSLVRVKNTSGTNREMGELLQISSYTGPTDNALNVPGNMAFSAGVLTWHTAIARAVVCAEPIPNNEYGAAVISGVCIVKVPSIVDNQFLMIDPATTKQCKASTSGVAKCLGVAGTNHAIAVWGMGQYLWRYELTENSLSPSDTTAKLLDLGGTNLSVGQTIELSDPDSLMDDQVSGNKGWCIHTGNKFFAIQAVCS
jgi:hypothetical protein